MGCVVRPEDPVVMWSLLHLFVIKMDPFFYAMLCLCCTPCIGILPISDGGPGGHTVGWKGKCIPGVNISSVKSKTSAPCDVKGCDIINLPSSVWVVSLKNGSISRAQGHCLQIEHSVWEGTQAVGPVHSRHSCHCGLSVFRSVVHHWSDLGWRLADIVGWVILSIYLVISGLPCVGCSLLNFSVRRKDLHASYSFPEVHPHAFF